MKMSDKINDIKRKIANDILTLMKTENLSWMKPWLHPQPAQNGESGHVYKGMNVFAVNMAMFHNSWTDPRFLTFNQMKKLGGSNKGQKSTAVIKFGTSKDKNNEDKRYSFARLHFVWNVEQITGLNKDDLIPLQDLSKISAPERNAGIDTMVEQIGIPVREAQAAFYRQQDDAVYMPPISTFVDTHEGASASDNYYSTLLHELIHATGPSFRIGRECYLKYHVNKKERAKEELVAEIGSALWRQKLGFDSPSNLINTASYVKSWIALLEEDYNTIFEAATKASQAIEHLEQINTELSTKAA
ncbi:MAG TPA: hypothetical protein DCX14_01245 [Flavobacteriales bacterium]|jgi:antirestriction protein ArdC|nr:hypothetical protein [Flavobacteriales bacterium]